MSERIKVLETLPGGKIKPEEAEALLKAMGEGSVIDKAEKKNKILPKFFCVNIDSKGKNGDKTDKVNARVPLNLLRAGVKLGALLPDKTQKTVSGALELKGINIDLTKLSAENIDELI